MLVPEYSDRRCARYAARDLPQMPNLVEEVKIISEPTNAAAFCVWNYEQQFHEPLNGRILVVDYGGGTLDTALVNVRQQKGQMQIKPEMRSGAGENHDNKIGEAGIAFQEAVARRAISEALDIPGDSIPYDAHFNQFLKDFEEQLLSQSDYVSQSMQEFSFAPDGLRDITLCGLTYDGSRLTLTCISSIHAIRSIFIRFCSAFSMKPQPT